MTWACFSAKEAEKKKVPRSNCNVKIRHGRGGVGWKGEKGKEMGGGEGWEEQVGGVGGEESRR